MATLPVHCALCIAVKEDDTGYRKKTQVMSDSGLAAILQGDQDYPVSQSVPSNGSVILQLEHARVIAISQISQWRDRATLDTIRPLPVFFGFDGLTMCLAADAFTPPSTKFDKGTSEKISQRIQLNTAYFLSNYALIVVGTCVIVTLLHPIMIMFITTMYILWKTHAIMVESNIPIVIMGKDLTHVITNEFRTHVMNILTLVVVIVYCLKPFLTAVGLSGLIILSHAVMRDPKQIESVGMIKKYGADDSDESEGTDSSEVLVEKIDAV